MSILGSDAISEAIDNLDNDRHAVVGPSKAANKTNTQTRPKPRPKFTATQPDPSSTSGIPSQLSPILEQRGSSVPRIEALKTKPDAPAPQATTARSKPLKGILAPSPFGNTGDMGGEPSTDSDGTVDKEEGGSEGVDNVQAPARTLRSKKAIKYGR